MILTYTSSTEITIDSTPLNSFISSPSSYSKLEVIGDISCSGVTTTKTYTSTSPITSSTSVQTSGGVEKIVPSFFSATTFASGVYSFEVKLTTLAGSVSKDKGCLVVLDSTFICQFTELDDLMKIYTLQQSQSCDCSCSKLCEIYSSLTTKTTSCGCS